ncbi:MAG: hypothetical protein ACK5LT_06590 [Lachnospirales bacterium]
MRYIIEYNYDKKQDNYNEFFGFGQIKIPLDLFEVKVPEDNRVHTLIKIMEKLKYNKLYQRDLCFMYLTKGVK